MVSRICVSALLAFTCIASALPQLSTTSAIDEGIFFPLNAPASFNVTAALSTAQTKMWDSPHFGHPQATWRIYISQEDVIPEAQYNQITTSIARTINEQRRRGQIFFMDRNTGGRWSSSDYELELLSGAEPVDISTIRGWLAILREGFTRFGYTTCFFETRLYLAPSTIFPEGKELPDTQGWITSRSIKLPSNVAKVRRS